VTNEGEDMKKLLLLGATFAAAVVAGIGASAAFAGEVTGNCNKAPNEKSAANCKDDYSQGRSECKFSGQNDNPAEAFPDDGRTQSYGQLVKRGVIDPRQFNPGDACNPNAAPPA
jgi:hypothetical protein